MDFASPTVHKSGNQLHVAHGNDSNLFAEFFMKAVEQKAESLAQGRPIFKDVEHIRIIVPGDRTKVVEREVRLHDDAGGGLISDVNRFPAQYAAFKAQTEQVVSGTPIVEWPLLTRSQAMELKGMHFHTVEQLAGASDTQLGSFFGGKELRNKAASWLDTAKGGAEAARVAEENKNLKADIEMLKQQLSELGKTVEGKAEKKTLKLNNKTED